MRAAVVATVVIICLAPAAADARRKADRCAACHTRETPAAVQQWRASAHARRGVGCSTCHGQVHPRPGVYKGDGAKRVFVGVKVCARCHPKAAKAHMRSRHGIGLHTGWGCTRALKGRARAECRFCHEKGSALPKAVAQCAIFLKQSSAMGQAGCNGCHQIERSCAACHSNHATALKIVRHPNVCAKCHMGPDHPQWESWKTSMHGTLFISAGPKLGPGCQTCHMPRGSHDVSRGLTMTPTGKIFPPKQAARQRGEMLRVCRRCHARAFAARELTRGDQIRAQSRALVSRAKAVVRDLARRGLLDPMPAKRAPHPQLGHKLVLGPQLLYEDTSHIERLLFKMKKFALAKTVKGAYHQNPAYAHWYGNAELKMTLVDILAEASRLRSRARPVAPTGSAAVEQRLRELKRQRASGALTADAYRRAKRALLRRFLKRR